MQCYMTYQPRPEFPGLSTLYSLKPITRVNQSCYNWVIWLPKRKKCVDGIFLCDCKVNCVNSKMHWIKVTGIRHNWTRWDYFKQNWIKQNWNNWLKEELMQKLIELDKIELNWWRREAVLSNNQHNGNRKKCSEQLQKVFH